MTYECNPDLASAVAGRLTSALDGVAAAGGDLLATASSNGTFDLTAGVQMLVNECVEEVGLVASVLINLASAIQHADAFDGADAFFSGEADKALMLLLGSLSDGRGDLGGGTPQSRYDRLIAEVWPAGIPGGISYDDFVAAMVNHPRSRTMTPTELAAIWPLLPSTGRETFAARQPVTVLDLVVDGGLTLTAAELDAAARSILVFPPSAEVDVDPQLAAALNGAAWDHPGIPQWDRTGVALDRADILMAAGPAGRDYRDATNMGITYVALVIGLQARGTAQRTDDGLIVVTVPRDASISLDDLLGTELVGASVQPYGKGGTTFGNTFIVPARRDGGALAPELLHHENIHTYQWAAAGPKEYGALYIGESLKSGVQDFVEHVDPEINWVDPGKIDLPKIPSVQIPGTDRLPSWVPTGTPSIDLPTIDIPSVPVPGVDVEWTFNTGCHNRFEEHAGLDDGGYDSCEP